LGLNFFCADERKGKEEIPLGFYVLDFFGFLFMAVIPALFISLYGLETKSFPEQIVRWQGWTDMAFCSFYGGLVAGISFWRIEGEKNGERREEYVLLLGSVSCTRHLHIAAGPLGFALEPEMDFSGVVFPYLWQPECIEGKVQDHRTYDVGPDRSYLYY
jgi:hypothetical protein